MVQLLLGSAWAESVKDAPERKVYRVLLDLGVIGALRCRIVENSKPTKEVSPSHYVFFTPLTGGEDVKIGALWPHKTESTGAEYPIGELDLAALGVVEMKGGAKLDLRLVNERIGVRLSEVRERTSEKSPTHQLWRMTPRSKMSGPPGSVASTSVSAACEEEASQLE